MNPRQRPPNRRQTKPPQTPSPQPKPATPEGERLQKLIAAAGLASRRTVEAWISAGRVALNGRAATLGERAQPGDRIEVDGKPVAVRPAQRRTRVIAYHKPLGELVTRNDPEGRPTVFNRLPPLEEGKWIAVGRLDFNTSGLLLFTDDGELANTLMHPRFEVEREYAIRVQGALDDNALGRLHAGVMVDGEPARFTRIGLMPGRKGEGSNRWYTGVLKEGRNREVRKLIEVVGARVSALRRVRYGAQELPRDLAAGAWRELPPATVETLVRIAKEGKIR